MAKYTIMMSCGHEDTVELVGKTTDRERKIEYFKANGLCKNCYKKKMEKQTESEKFTFNASVLPYIDEENGSILLTVWFSGNTMPHKDAIKSLGEYRWSERQSSCDFIDIKKPPMCWNKIIKSNELKNEIAKAVSIGAESTVADSGIFAMVNYQIAIDSQKTWIRKNEEISAIEKPSVPSVLVGHKWNQKIYGRLGNYSIYLDGNKVLITDDDAEEIKSYLQAVEEYQNKISMIKKEK